MNIGIVGAGIIGRLLAFTLVRSGHRVTLYDKTNRFDRNTASQVAAGMLAPFAELEGGVHDILSLSRDAIAQWKAIIRQMTLCPTIHTQGSILSAKAQNRSQLEHFVLRMKSLGLRASLIDDNAIGDLEPDLSGQDLCGIYLEDEGYVNTQETLDLLAVDLDNMNVIWHEDNEVLSISNNAIRTQENTSNFDRVFDCRGMGAKQDLKNLRAVRGELILIHAPIVNLTRPVRLLHPRYPLYIVPRGENHYIVGSTQIESEDYSPISVQSTLELLSACYSLHPGFAEARIIHSKTQCRPAFSDNLPAITSNEHCISINGMYRHGFLLAPHIVSRALTYL
jgi:glycine oxidase